MANTNETGGKTFRVIGTRPIRHDGVDKVTGRAKYGADYAFPGMLHGKTLRSPHAHALIKSINIDKALKLPGVKAIITSADLPELPDKIDASGEIPTNLSHVSCNVLARGKVLYDGHAVAAVAATSAHIAEEAVQAHRSRLSSAAARDERRGRDEARCSDPVAEFAQCRGRRPTHQCCEPHSVAARRHQ